MASKREPRKNLGRTAKYYRDNPDAAKRKAATDKKINSRPEQILKRRELERKRVEAKKRGADTSRTDWDHAVGRRVGKSVNRGRTGEGARRKKK